MKKKRKKKLTPEEEKQVDHFAERLANILLTQVEQEAIAKEDAEKLSTGPGAHKSSPDR